MPVPRILLLTDVLPDASGGGGSVYLSSLCSMYPEGQMALCLFGAGPEAGPPSLPMPYTFVRTPRPKGYGRRLPRILSRYYRWPVEVWIDRFLVPALVRRIVDFGRSFGAERLWVPLSVPHAMRLARRVAAQLQLPLYLTVWDPPEYKLPRFGLHGALQRRFLKIFAADMAAAKRCGVMSDEMKRRYESRYGVPCVVMTHGVPEKHWQEPAARPLRPDRLVIAFAGSLYALSEWRALLAALAGAGWEVAGRKVVLRLLSDRVEVLPNQPAHLEFYGWRSFDETLDLLARSDVCYLPYWMDERYRDTVRLTFPTKLSLYLASGRPVFYHGPRDASPTPFFERFPAGVCCHSWDGEEILAALTRLAGDGAAYARATRAGREALQQALGQQVFRRRFAEFLDIPEGELLPL